MVVPEKVVLLDRQNSREIEENGYKYLRILEADEIEESKMKMKFRKEYIRRLKLVLKS